MTPSTLACRNGATTGRRWRLLAMLAVLAVCTATRTADAGFSCVTEGAPCDDGLKCTVFDECHNGQCIGSSIICNSADLCLQGACNPDTGECESVPTSCDDQNGCTADSCDSSTGNCVHDPLTGPTCDDGDNCTTDDQCNDGRCEGTPRTCPQGRCAFVPVGCFADQDCNFTVCASPEDAVPALPQGCETNTDCTTPPYTVCTPSHCTLPPVCSVTATRLLAIAHSSRSWMAPSATTAAAAR